MPGAVSTFNRASKNLPAFSAASSIRASDSWCPVATRGEYSSTTTGCFIERRMVSASKVCSVTSMT